MRKKKLKTWYRLKTGECPNCKAPLEEGMIKDGFLKCANVCGFTIKKEVKNLLVKRDHEED